MSDKISFVEVVEEFVPQELQKKAFEVWGARGEIKQNTELLLMATVLAQIALIAFLGPYLGGFDWVYAYFEVSARKAWMIVALISIYPVFRFFLRPRLVCYHDRKIQIYMCKVASDQKLKSVFDLIRTKPLLRKAIWF